MRTLSPGGQQSPALSWPWALPAWPGPPGGPPTSEPWEPQGARRLEDIPEIQLRSSTKRQSVSLLQRGAQAPPRGPGSQHTPQGMVRAPTGEARGQDEDKRAHPDSGPLGQGMQDH